MNQRITEAVTGENFDYLEAQHGLNALLAGHVVVTWTTVELDKVIAVVNKTAIELRHNLIVAVADGYSDTLNYNHGNAEAFRVKLFEHLGIELES